PEVLPVGREQQRDEAGDDEGNQQDRRFAPPDGDRDREAGGPERGRGGDPPQGAVEQPGPERLLEDRGEEEARLQSRGEGVDGQDGRGRRQARAPREVGTDAVERAGSGNARPGWRGAGKSPGASRTAGRPRAPRR